MNGPAFIRVVPAEIERYGPAAAVVLAHIRFRCATEGPDRTVVAGERWWRTSYAEIGREVGMSRPAVRRVMEQLANKAVEVWDHGEEDRRRSYRIAPDLPKYESGTPATCQSTDSAHPVPDSAHPVPDSAHPCAESSPCTMYLEELGEVEEGGENAGSVHAKPTPRKPGQLANDPPTPSNSPQPQKISSTRLPAVPNDNEAIDAELVDEDDAPEPPVYCTAHAADPGAPCNTCKRLGSEHEAWEAREAARVTADLLRAAAAAEAAKPPPPPKRKCGKCQDTGIVLNSDGRPGPDIRICHCDGIGHHIATPEEIASLGVPAKDLIAQNGGASPTRPNGSAPNQSRS